MTEAITLLVRSHGVNFVKLHQVRTVGERNAAGLAAENGTEWDHMGLSRLIDEMVAAEAGEPEFMLTASSRPRSSQI